MSKNQNSEKERFAVAKSTLYLDSWAKRLITLVGVSVILAVFGIFVFIFNEVRPLFSRTELKLNQQLETQLEFFQTPLLGVDEWSELPFFYTGNKEVEFLPIKDARGKISLPLELGLDDRIEAFSLDNFDNHLIVALGTGNFLINKINYKPDFSGKKRVIKPKIEPILRGQFEKISPIYFIASRLSDSRGIVVALFEEDQKQSVIAKSYHLKNSLLAKSRWKQRTEQNLSDLAGIDQLEKITVLNDASSVVASSSDGAIYCFKERNREFVLAQKFYPFGKNEKVERIDQTLGGGTLIFSNSKGLQLGYTSYREDENDEIKFHPTKHWKVLAKKPSVFAASLRNRSFLMATNNEAALIYGTTGKVLAKIRLPIEPVRAVFDEKHKNLLLLDKKGKLLVYTIEGDYPDAGMKAFFGKVWYEGKSKPSWDWQSTGGSTEFEPKLSVVPLLYGALKGTFYSLLFAIPIAILAAIYTAYFLDPRMKRYVKPIMEIMASLPSVVLGFLAALWLAPLIEHQVPALILCLLGLPILIIVIGMLWELIPLAIRKRFTGWEWLIISPFLIVLMTVLWKWGGDFESLCFTISQFEIRTLSGELVETIQGAANAVARLNFFEQQDEKGFQLIDLGIAKNQLGHEISNFSLWWSLEKGWGDYDQRNSLVIGIMMGFATIPIIFTLTEDAISNVPTSLTSASIALGASRWQTIRGVILPVASAGIFSAIIVGFGRAVGETMIVIMATGNTPVMDWNIFNGMRTLAANIAVELPEAPKGSTHYRTLFLGAFLLFILTFVINTVAEFFRYRLRKKFELSQ